MSRLAITLLSLCACATTSQSLDKEFTPTGEVALYDRIVTFDSTSVRSSQIQLSTKDGREWSGRVMNQLMYVTVDANSARGPGFNMELIAEADGSTTVSGQYQGRFFRAELTGDHALVRGNIAGAQLQGREAEPGLVTYGTKGGYGQSGYLQLKGDAAELRWPHVGFALFAIMN